MWCSPTAFRTRWRSTICEGRVTKFHSLYQLSAQPSGAAVFCAIQRSTNLAGYTGARPMSMYCRPGSLASCGLLEASQVTKKASAGVARTARRLPQRGQKCVNVSRRPQLGATVYRCVSPSIWAAALQAACCASCKVLLRDLEDATQHSTGFLNATHQGVFDAKEPTSQAYLKRNASYLYQDYDIVSELH